jgi:ParB family chromosome partitioning protein
MTTRRKGLGRGLDALLGGQTSGAVLEEPRVNELSRLPVETISRGKYQPRAEIPTESLEELASSIKVQGVVQPIVVRPTGEPGNYEIIAGERRWRAAQLAGLAEVPAIVKDVTDEAAVAIALIENIQREDLNPIDEATALKRLIDEFGMTHQGAADAVGRSRAAVSNLLRLLDLNEDVGFSLARGDLEMGHARALLGLEGDSQSQAARRVVAKGLSVRETERLVKRLKSEPVPVPRATGSRDPDVRRLEEQLSGKLGARVDIHHKPAGGGRLEIRYSSLEELDGILSKIA